MTTFSYQRLPRLPEPRVGYVRSSHLNKLARNIDNVADAFRRAVDNNTFGNEEQQIVVAGAAPVHCTIQSEEADHLVTVLLGTSTIVYVAKPYNLRGDVAARTVNGEPQIILPAYAFGSSIFVIAVDDTGLSDTPAGRAINLDMNVDGRTWAENT